MNHKVLLADDSLTIQKVIKITLANQPYDIKEASSEDELFRELPSVQPKLVFLDFNLSEKYTGYELTTKIKSICPNAKVLLLLGTFDTIDDASMEKCGASDKIVKPFDSNKFISICKQLIDTFAEEEIPYPEEKVSSNSNLSFEVEEDNWQMSHTTEQSFPEPARQEKTAPAFDNPLLKEVSDWGMSVPGIINDQDSHDIAVDLPPVIEADVSSLQDFKTKKEISKDEPKFPQNDDLDYPTIEELSAPKQTASLKEPSKLISIDTFNDQPMELEILNSYVADDADIKSLEEQIRDEVEDNLWHADEFEDLKKEVSAKIEEVKGNFQPTINDFDESLFKPIDDSSSISWTDTDIPPETSQAHATTHEPVQAINLEEMKRDMEEMVKKYVKEYMDQMFQKNAEKIAWEVIPDLAENLIRQELSKISNKILNE